MEPEDGIHRRPKRPTASVIDRFTDGKIGITLVELPLPGGERQTLIQIRQTINAGTSSERSQVFGGELDSFGAAIERALVAFKERDGEPIDRELSRETSTPRPVVTIHEGRTVAEVVERWDKQGDRQEILYLSREGSGPGDLLGGFLGTLRQLAGIYNAARAIEREHAERPRLESGEEELSHQVDEVTSPWLLPVRGEEEGESWLAVVRLEGLAEKAGSIIVQVAKMFPEEEKTKAGIFADTNPRCVLWPIASRERFEEGVHSFEVTREELLDYESVLGKLDREIRGLEHRREVESPEWLVGVWNEKARRPERGMEVKWGSNEDFRREPEDYRVEPRGTQRPQGPNDPPVYVLIRKDLDYPPHHRIEGVFATRAEAINAFQEKKQELAQERAQEQARTLKPLHQESFGPRRKL